TRGPARRQDHDVQAAQTHPHRRPLRPARARPARPQPMETTARDPRLLRHQPVERARRRDQWTPRAPARHRPGLPESDPLHLAVPDPFRPAPRTHQRTLKPEEPFYGAKWPRLMKGLKRALNVAEVRRFNLANISIGILSETMRR